MTDRLADLTAQGVSLWLDDLSRQRLHSGNLKDLIGTWHISGVTTNPSIFQAALANPRPAYQAFEKTFTGPHWEALEAKGRKQTTTTVGVHRCQGPPVRRHPVRRRARRPGTINTAPEKTIAAVADHGEITGNTIDGTNDQAGAVFSSLEAAGVDLNDVFAVLETEGVDRFIASWQELLDSVSTDPNISRGPDPIGTGGKRPFLVERVGRTGWPARTFGLPNSAPAEPFALERPMTTTAPTAPALDDQPIEQVAVNTIRTCAWTPFRPRTPATRALRWRWPRLPTTRR